MIQLPVSQHRLPGRFAQSAKTRVPEGVGGGLKRSSLLMAGALAAGMVLWPSSQAQAGPVNCGYVDIGGVAYVTCVDGAEGGSGGLVIDMEDETITLNAVPITPDPFVTEDKDAVINLGYSDAVGEGLYIETTDSDGVFIYTDDNDITTIDFKTDGNITASGSGILVTADSWWDGRGDVVINSRGDITAGVNGIYVWRTDGAEGGTTADVDITNDGTILAGNNGIQVQADGNVTVTNTGSIGTVADPIGGTGVYISSIDGYGNATVNNTSPLSIHALGDGVFIQNKESATVNNNGGTIIAGDDGIEINDISGDVNVYNDAGTIEGGDYGILIDNIHTDGDVFISNVGGSITGSANEGISVDAVSAGNVEIDNTGGTITSINSDGVDFDDISGYAMIDNTRGTITGGSDGIDLGDIGSYVQITNSNDYTTWWAYDTGVVATITGVDDGIVIDGTGSYVSINNTDGVITGTNGDGIDLEDIGGYVSITNIAGLYDFYGYYDLYGIGGSISGGNHGIVIDGTEDYVTIDNTRGTITGISGDGINLDDIDGSVTITNDYGIIEGGNNGIYITDLWTSGDPLLLSITNTNGSIAGNNGSGIYIDEIDNGNVNISNYYGFINGFGDEGISVSDVQGGDVTITNDGGEGGGGSIYGYWDGIDINNISGNVDIENDYGTITGDYGQGIDISNIGGYVQITNLGGMYYSGGEIVGNNGSAIRIAGVDGSVTIDNGDGGEGYSGGLIRGDGAEGEAVIHVSGVAGMTTINNQYGGVIRSNDDLASDVAIRVDGGEGDGAATINNYGTITGRVYLTDNNDVFNNYSYDSWYVEGDNDFGDGYDVLNNSGAIYVSGVTNFFGLEELNNEGGLIDLSYADGSTNTRLTTSGNYDGGEGGYLVLDAYLSTYGDSTADLFTIEGDVSGTTYVYINDFDTSVPGAYNEIGVKVISVGGTDYEDSFVLANGPINKGYWQYELYREETNSSDWWLASTPSDQAFELPILMSTAQEAWHQTTGVWLDRQADLRVAGAGNGGAWAKLIGGSIDRDVSNTYTHPLYGTDSTHNQSYDQSLFGVMVGADTASQGAGGETWVIGVLGGMTQSRVDFDSTATDADRDAVSIGAYVTYLNGGWFVDAVVKGDIGDTDYRLEDGALTQDFSLDTTSVGVTLDAGYRIQNGSSFIEPMATLSYVRTSIDDVTAFPDDINPTDINFANGTSLRGRIGVRAGTSIDSASGTKYEPFVQASLWNEFDGDNSVTLTSDDMDVTVKDKGIGSYGQIGAGINIFGTGNVTGFAKVDAVVGGDDYDSLTGSVGVRYKW
ncbi:MAG: autotransporter outer membrane beta-barrel domain-containing protein [Gammaproteobacteria bacterium]|nr:autotransporter outer membrane beta-barrel domain-containing protein [Gammaproteobacteria bacterium]